MQKINTYILHGITNGSVTVIIAYQISCIVLRSAAVIIPHCHRRIIARIVLMVIFYRQHINEDLITYLPELGLQHGDHILVPLCGKTKDMVWLAKQGFQVTGIELSSIACADFFTGLGVKPQISHKASFTVYQHDNITLLCGDLFKLQASDLPPVHAIFDCKALIALPAAIRQIYVNHLCSCFGTKIKILLLVIESDNKTGQPPYSVTAQEIDQLYGAHFPVKHVKKTADLNISQSLVEKGVTQKIDHVYLIG